MSVHAESTSAARPKARKAVHPGDVQHATDAGLDLLRVIGRLVLHNVSLPGRPDLVIDHVVAGPSGVYVINTVAPTGSVSMSGGILLCAGTSMMSDIHEAADSAAILRELLSGAPVAPILCFQRNAEVAGVVGEVAVCSTENILELLSGQPDVVDARTQREVMRVLSDSLVQAVRRERVEPEPGTKPRHRQKAWSLRRSNNDDAARKAEPTEFPEPPRLVAEPVPVPPPPAPKVELELVPELAPDLEPDLAPEADEVLEVAVAPVLELAPALVEPEPVAPVVEDVVEPVVEDVVPARPVARAPARPAARAATRPAARPAARLPEAPRVAPRVAPRHEAPVEAAVEPTTPAPVTPAPVTPAPVAPAAPAAPAASAPVTSAPVIPAPVTSAPVVPARVAPAPAAGPVWTPAPAAAERPVVEAVEAEVVPAAPEGRHARTPLAGPALKKASVLLARLAPAEPVESVSALKDAAFPVRPVLVPKVEQAPAPTAVTPAVPGPVEVVAPEVAPVHPNSPQNIAPAPVPRPTLTVAAPPADEPPARRRLGGLVPVLIGALIVGAVLMLSPRVPAAVAWGKGLFTDPPTPAAGTLVHVDGTATDPGYDLTASAPVAVRSAGTSVRPGHRLVAVKVRVHNGGDAKLALPVTSRMQVVDALGIGYSPATAVKKTNLGPALPKLVSVGPGATLVGTVVFSVPAARAVDQIQFRLPDSDALAWDVPTD